ncbi:MAG: class I SAM-dependent methyltransferase [Dongiaceae bacterium]
MAGDTYIMRGGAEGRERLRLLSRVLAPGTRALLDRSGLRPGLSCLDVGTGGGDVARDLARRVAPTGRVVGTDIDEEALAIARGEAAAAGIANLTFLNHDAASGPVEPGAFDVVHARFLLSHLRDPAGALAAMAASLAPGGLLLLQDADLAGHFCYPPSPAHDRYLGLYAAAATARGGDPGIGPKLPAMLVDLGLGGVDLSVTQPAAMSGETKRMSPVTLAMVADALIDLGLASPPEIVGLLGELEALAADDRTVLGLPRVVQCWGRRPR